MTQPSAPDGSSPAPSDAKRVGAETAARAWGAYFLVMGVLLLLVSMSVLADGALPLKPAASGLLFVVLGLDIQAGRRRALFWGWFLAAVPIWVTPAGLLLIVTTILFTLVARRRWRSIFTR